MSRPAARMPRWAELALLPVLNLAIALLAAAVVVAAIGQDPWKVLQVMVQGAFGSARAWSYTLYYATTFVFTGLAVAVALHGGLFPLAAQALDGPDALERWRRRRRCCGYPGDELSLHWF